MKAILVDINAGTEQKVELTKFKKLIDVVVRIDINKKYENHCYAYDHRRDDGTLIYYRV